ncbi:signal peptidase I [Desulfitobacterium chlororespirans]|uniref:Signal peptidase I n=1 Tax=Desulfitobacterium chlororespirans DSM 11544 TaxID=1121395 RepID=A0A1M7SMU1_9FIRM|nr:signal peptidase I [Desulfitobacterium chlororespirans]SHN59744.1 signal peptidase I [Desulfitobacterium chlororespirans DSM 11544]
MENAKNIKPTGKSTVRNILEWVVVIVIAFALSWLIRTFVIEPRYVPSGSMLPTIQLQDRLIVDKFFFKYFGELHPGDIIVFHPPSEAHASDDFIKRLIALPGDTVGIRNHQTYINGQAIDEPYLAEPQIKTMEPVVVPEGYVFVMGDNRNDSKDSREWGFLPMDSITGRTLFRYWPLEHFGVKVQGYVVNV